MHQPEGMSEADLTALYFEQLDEQGGHSDSTIFQYKLTHSISYRVLWPNSCSLKIGSTGRPWWSETWVGLTQIGEVPSAVRSPQ